MDGPGGATQATQPGPAAPFCLELLRVSVLPEGAFGVLIADGVPFTLTLERTSEGLGGEQLVKIPVGTWPCRRSYFYRGGYDTYEVLVPGHSRLLFHKGNLEDDSEGCILVGQRFGLLKGKPAVLDSEQGFMRFMWQVGTRQSFDLAVREA